MRRYTAAPAIGKRQLNRLSSVSEQTLNSSFNDPVLDELSQVEAARRGDVDAFNQLIERYQRPAYSLAYRTLGEAEAAADATQEAFLSAFRAVHDFRGQSFKAWLLRIVVNACYDELRRRQRRPAASLEAMAEQTEVELRSSDAIHGPEATAARYETAEVIQQALQRLPPDQRMVVVLCDVQGMSYEEAAVVLDVAMGTVKSRLSRARARLRDELVARGELPRTVERPSSEDLAAR
jgi:RNA polymerase sigma-70 factor, ECF subfamily